MKYGFSDELWDQSQKVLKSGDTLSSVVILGHKSNGTEKFFNENGGYCHAKLQYPACKNILFTPSLIVTRTGEVPWDPVFSEENVPYVSWLVNDSPWSDIFVEKNPAKIQEYGYIISTDFPNNYVVGGVIAARHSWEFRTTKLKTWFTLTKKFGVDPSAAFVLMYMYRFGSGVLQQQGWGNHNSIGYNREKKYFLNWFNKDLKNPEGSYTETKTYRGIDNLWSTENKYPTSDKFYCKLVYNDWINSTKVKKTVVKNTDVNPFAKNISLMRKRDRRNDVSIEGKDVQSFVDFFQKDFLKR